MIATFLVTAALAFLPGASESFESMSSLPPEWQFVEYTGGNSTVSLEDGDAADGQRFLRLSAQRTNHTRLLMPTTVDKQSTYRFSAMVRASAPQDVTAVLTLDGPSGVITEAVPGDGEWHQRDLYVRTGEADAITMALSLGWFGETVVGDADFDVIKLEKVDSAPSGAPVADTVAPVVVELGPSRALLPLTVALLVLVAGCGAVLVRGDRVS